jgi:hypothetical protein
MNPEQDNSKQLQRLLALKRHEQPPPGYFENFSGQIIARLQAGERSAPDSFWEWLSLEASWLHKLWVALETKPVFAGAFGAGVCGLLLAGVLYSQSIEPAPVTGFMAGVDQTPVAAQAPASPALLSQTAGYDFSTTTTFRGPLLPENQSWSHMPTLERASFTQPLGSQ